MANNKLKFLDIVGLTQLVSEIKIKINNAITTATNKTLISEASFDKTNGIITLKQGTDNSVVKTIILDVATTEITEGEINALFP